jgi:ketosteroid isomerase-like protein
MNHEILLTNLAAVQVHFDAEKAGDWEKIKIMYTDDIVWERACMDQIVKGKEAVAAAYVELFSALRNVDFQCLDRFATEDRVVDESMFTFEIAKDGIMPLPVGTRAELRLVHIFEMRDGKVSRELVMETPPQPL